MRSNDEGGGSDGILTALSYSSCDCGRSGAKGFGRERTSGPYLVSAISPLNSPVQVASGKPLEDATDAAIARYNRKHGMSPSPVLKSWKSADG